MDCSYLCRYNRNVHLVPVIERYFSAPTVLKAHGVALGKNVTSYPAMKDQLNGEYKYQEDKVVVDDKLITSRGPGTAYDFALTIIDKLIGKEKASEVAQGLLLTY